MYFLLLGAADVSGSSEHVFPGEDCAKTDDKAEPSSPGGLLVKIGFLFQGDDTARRDCEYPKAPPPTRNTSDTDLSRNGDEDEEEDILVKRRRLKRAKTPPPSRSSNAAQDEEYVINDFDTSGDGDEGHLLQLPNSGGKSQSSQSSTPGQCAPHRSMQLTNEVAAAMTFSLGAQGFKISEDDEEDSLDQTSFIVLNDSSEERSVSSLNSYGLPSDFSIIDDPTKSHQIAAEHSAIVYSMNGHNANVDNNANQNANPDSDNATPQGKSSEKQPAPAAQPMCKSDIEETFYMCERNGWEGMTAKHAEVLSSLITTTDQQLLERVLLCITNAAAFTQNQVSLHSADT